MENIKCCIIKEKEIYRGIDREVDMRIFNNEKKDVVYEKIYNQYLLYLSTEGENTSQNLEIMSSFCELVNSHYGKCELIMYSVHPIENGLPYLFLGVDIIDEHLKSVIKKGVATKINLCRTNQYNLYSNDTDAQMVIHRLKEKSKKYVGIYKVYVYLV